MKFWIIKCTTDNSVFQCWGLSGSPRFTDIIDATTIAVHDTKELAETNIENIEYECSHFKGKLAVVEINI